MRKCFWLLSRSRDACFLIEENYLMVVRPIRLAVGELFSAHSTIRSSERTIPGLEHQLQSRRVDLRSLLHRLLVFGWCFFVLFPHLCYSTFLDT